MSIDTMDKLLVDELKDLYSAESQITKALPKMAKGASSSELRSAFENHLKETEGHVQRLEKIFETLGGSPKGKTCNGMKGLLSEGAEMLEETAKGDVRDAALISAAQRVEHYEMAAHGAARSFAERLGQSQIAQTLEKTLQEEKTADEKTDADSPDNQQPRNPRGLKHETPGRERTSMPAPALPHTQPHLPSRTLPTSSPKPRTTCALVIFRPSHGFFRENVRIACRPSGHNPIPGACGV